jgi:hypothetical protein
MPKVRKKKKKSPYFYSWFPVCSSHTYRRSAFKIVFHMWFIARLTKFSRGDRHFLTSYYGRSPLRLH